MEKVHCESRNASYDKYKTGYGWKEHQMWSEQELGVWSWKKTEQSIFTHHLLSIKAWSYGQNPSAVTWFILHILYGNERYWISIQLHHQLLLAAKTICWVPDFGNWDRLCTLHLQNLVLQTDVRSARSCALLSPAKDTKRKGGELQQMEKQSWIRSLQWNSSHAHADLGCWDTGVRCGRALDTAAWYSFTPPRGNHTHLTKPTLLSVAELHSSRP